jgi:chemotaxis protein methyltransferase CheR
MEMDGTQSVEDIEIDLLLEGVFRHFGHDFRGYQRTPLKRRLHGLMQANGLTTVSALQDRVMHDKAAGEALLRALSMYPTAMFDDPEYCRALRQVLGSWLRSCPAPKMWIAECTSAEDAYTLAILLEEEELYQKTQIFATGANESLVQEASAGSFALERLGEYGENYRRSGGKQSLSDYCREVDGRAVFLPQISNNITWAQYNLATDASFNEFEVIICRSVLPDFGASLRRRTFRLFDESLSRFGMLSVDAPDDLDVAPFSTRYKAISRQQGLYRRIV